MQNPFMQNPFMQMQAGWPGACFALPLAALAGTGQHPSSRSTLPSLLAIQARVKYQNKRERDLNEERALFEYHQEKQDKHN
eukprot:6184040-Pleurochrysis_carterae.AAC.1